MFKVGDEVEITKEWEVQEGAICKITHIDKNPKGNKRDYYSRDGRDGCEYTLMVIKRSRYGMLGGPLFCGSSCMRLLNKPFEGDIEFEVVV